MGRNKTDKVRFECRALKELIPKVREYAKLISEQELLKQKKLTATAQKQL